MAQPAHVVVVTGGNWSFGLCDCMQDCGLCCDVCCCPCCAHGRVFSAAVEGRPNEMNVLVCLGMLFSYWLGGFPGCIAQTAVTWCTRDSVKSKYGIQEGTPCTDFCASCCCSPCATCQHHRELSKRGIPPGYTCCRPNEPKVTATAAAQPAYAGKPPQPQPVVPQAQPYHAQPQAYPHQNQPYPQPVQHGV